METATNGQATNPLEEKRLVQMENFGAELEAGTITRDSKGQFVPGNVGGPGRPKKLTYEIFWDTVKKHATPEALDEMIQVAFEMAKSGDAKARDAIIKLVGQLHEFEKNEQQREREEAQERIEVQYADILKKRDGFDFVIGEPSIAEEIYNNLDKVDDEAANLGNSE